LGSTPFSVGDVPLTELEAAGVASDACEAGKIGDDRPPKTFPFSYHAGVCGAGEATAPFGENGEAAKGDPVPANAANPVGRFGGGEGDGGGVTGAKGTSTASLASLTDCTETSARVTAAGSLVPCVNVCALLGRFVFLEIASDKTHDIFISVVDICGFYAIV
jgi:hypothetical protein